MNCDQALEYVQDTVDGRVSSTAQTPATAHLNVCLRCQAELAQFRRVRRIMSTFPDRRVEAPSAMAAQVMAIVRSPTEQFAVAQIAERATRTKRRAMVAIGAATAVAAGTAGVVVAATRNRRSLAMSSG